MESCNATIWSRLRRPIDSLGNAQREQ
jgi:hypothetical protein